MLGLGSVLRLGLVVISCPYLKWLCTRPGRVHPYIKWLCTRPGLVHSHFKYGPYTAGPYLKWLGLCTRPGRVHSIVHNIAIFGNYFITLF